MRIASAPAWWRLRRQSVSESVWSGTYTIYFRVIRSTHSSAQLAFNQEHEYSELLKRTAVELSISNRVRMLGARDDVAALMRALDLLVINSSVEACCLVILEAMACGVPVLATSTGGTPEIIEHGKDGWLVPLRDENALAAAILKLVGQPALRAQLVEHGRQRVTSHFGINRYMTEVQKFYLKSDVIDTSSLYRKRQNAAA